MRSRSIPSSSAMRGIRAQVSKSKLLNSARLGSLWPKMNASSVLIPNAAARSIARATSSRA